MASVLVLEDNADLREMYVEILAMGGHETVAVETAEEAISAVAAAQPDVAVIDLGILGGVERVVEALRQRGGAALIFASGARDLAERAAEMGAAKLQKPFSPDDLLQAVERAAMGKG